MLGFNVVAACGGGVVGAFDVVAIAVVAGAFVVLGLEVVTVESPGVVAADGVVRSAEADDSSVISISHKLQLPISGA